MILTITMNPSIDIAYQLDHFSLDTVNRVSETHKTPGGKGLNVTRVLSQIGDDVLASGLLGGKHGEYLEKCLDELSIRHSFMKIADETRNCIAILHEGKQTEILEKGPVISDETASAFLEKITEFLDKVEIVVISGSLPQGLPNHYYSMIIQLCQEYQVSVILDCSGAALTESLQSMVKPAIIKPNIEELSQLLGHPVAEDISSLKTALSQPLFESIDWVIVSLGANGMFAKHGQHFYRVTIPKITVVNPVGSGDSTVAGLASAYVAGSEDKELLKKANVLGMLNAQEKETGRVNLENYQNLYERIKVEEV